MLTIVIAVLVMGCGGPNAAYYESLLDDLAIPPTWELVHTTVQEPGGLNDCAPVFQGCPSVTRYYLVAGKPVDAYPEAKQVLATAGFSLDLDSGPECDLPPNGPACDLFGVRDSDHVRIAINNPGDDIDSLGIARDDRSIVQVAAEEK